MLSHRVTLKWGSGIYIPLVLLLSTEALRAWDAQNKEIVWECVLGDTTLEARGVVLAYPEEVITDSRGNIYVLQASSIEKFDRDGKHLQSVPLKKGKGPGEFFEAISFAMDARGNFYILDGLLRRVSTLAPDGRFIRSFKLDIGANRIALWHQQELLLLGLGEGHILHVYTKDGQRVRSFGVPFRPPKGMLDFATNPREWSVQGDIIYVANSLSYEVRKYVGSELEKTFQGPDDIPPPKLRRTKRGGVGVGISMGIFGIAHYSGQLYLTVVRPTNPPRPSLDIFDEKTGKLLQRIRNWYRIKAIDPQGRMYFIGEDRVLIGRLR